jgi:hypothetical protein
MCGQKYIRFLTHKHQDDVYISYIEYIFQYIRAYALFQFTNLRTVKINVEHTNVEAAYITLN